MKKISIFSFIVLFGFLGCQQPAETLSADNLYEGFKNPPAEARPFIRWWWNGNHLDKKELSRQLTVMNEAGIGGVEINPIAMPDEAKDVGTQPIEWLSKEWNQMLQFASQEAKTRGMISDIIVGSGWPFGGEFLKKEETIQKVLSHSIPVKGGETIEENLDALYTKAHDALVQKHEEAPLEKRMFYMRLVPVNAAGPQEGIDLLEEFNKGQSLKYTVPKGNHELRYGILLHGHREVMHGAKGAAGPVMNHYDKEVTLAYLNRLQKISEDTGVPLNELLRALFCDSIELAGANWTDELQEIFFQTYGYHLTTYLPFVFYEPHTGYEENSYSEAFKADLRRVRYDYNKLLVDVFIENFVKPFQQYCTDNGLICRYQAYGIPFLMGLSEANLIADMPESNNWLYTIDMETDEYVWNQGHGYMSWNMYAASGGHLKGRKIVSVESMTNTGGVFKTSLEEIKRHDDMNFITGMNHSVLHGYNYSPVEAGFPGWIRYGSYFSEQNTWWPYFKRWTDYNSRLSYVFQNSQPLRQIAVMAPAGDIWSEKGLARVPFHLTPWYANRLWEPLSQAGSSCDYINEQIIIDGDVSGGTLKYGPMQYEAIVLTDVASVLPETATALLKYVKEGGKLLLVDKVPNKALGFKNATENDQAIRNTFRELLHEYPDQVINTSGPVDEDQLLTWTMRVLESINIQPQLKVVQPDKNVFQIAKRANDRDVYFFVNSNKKETVSVPVVFAHEKKTAWVWNPEDGTRTVAEFEKNGQAVNLELDPLQSLLIVFEPQDEETEKQHAKTASSKPGKSFQTLSGPWEVAFNHVNGTTFSRTMDTLTPFSMDSDEPLSSFAGTITYSTRFNADEKGAWITLEKANRGVTEVYLNGKLLGTNWYGSLKFPVGDALKEGENQLTIKHTTALANYAKSLKDDATALRWSSRYKNTILGLEGDAHLFFDQEPLADRNTK
ncbi:Tat pathway signal sequence domain-containing protein [Flammeovirgaceae bacterium 311]|nr:Tat pathway signal sequence domain-containing protein [Flammeovirgaceae bacterium 311]